MTTHGERIKELDAGQAVALEKIPLGGALEARRLGGGGVVFYWRYTENKATRREPIGAYDSVAPPKSLKPTARGYSIQAALEKARSLAKENIETPGGLLAGRERVRAASADAHREAVIALRYNLSSLCELYVRHLRDQGKSSWSDVENIFENHVKKAFPEIAALPAKAVAKPDVVRMLRNLTQDGKITTARKLRSGLRAAFACALVADSDSEMPVEFQGFRVAANPVEGTVAIKPRADKNPLVLDQLRTYWQALKPVDGPKGAALRLQLLLGGQRVQQLARLTADQVLEDELKLIDPKGNREEPRNHLLPVSKPIRTQLAQLPRAGFVLSEDGGKTAMAATALSTWSVEIAKAAGLEDFQLKRVRSGIETLLSKAGVPKHIRGQLQSHGISGIQDTHYDDHEYLPEKREALALLYRILEGAPVPKPNYKGRKSGA